MDKIVSIKNLTIQFNRNIEVVKNINRDVIKGKTTAIVGESGSGKTLSALSILKLLPNGAEIKNGDIFFNNVNLLKLNNSEIQKINVLLLASQVLNTRLLLRLRSNPLVLISRLEFRVGLFQL